MTSWHSYPSIYALGHRALADLLLDDVVIQEKIDGSQFSFGWFKDYPISDGFRMRSKGAQLNIEAPEKMFKKAVDYVKSLELRDGWAYRGEYLQSPKHNTLAYDRTPKNHIILFDINDAEESYLPHELVVEEAERLGLEAIPLFFHGKLESADALRELLNTTSCLGGQKVEGVVIKNYSRFGPDKKALMGKFVSEMFKEVHAKDWKERNPGKKDIIEALIDKYRTPARWEKAVQHLRDAGQITDSPRDIGNLIKELWPDILKECKDDIADALMAWAEKDLQRGVIRGLPEWYKEKLLGRQFEQES
jgi:hypothetical protein